MAPLPLVFRVPCLFGVSIMLPLALVLLFDLKLRWCCWKQSSIAPIWATLSNHMAYTQSSSPRRFLFSTSIFIATQNVSSIHLRLHLWKRICQYKNNAYFSDVAQVDGTAFQRVLSPRRSGGWGTHVAGSTCFSCGACVA